MAGKGFVRVVVAILLSLSHVYAQAGILVGYDTAASKGEVVAGVRGKGYDVVLEYRYSNLILVTKKGQLAKSGPPATQSDMATVKSASANIKFAENDNEMYFSARSPPTASPSTCPSPYEPNTLTAGEYTPYGIQMVQATDRAFQTTTAKNNVKNNVVFCVMDSGISKDHPDLHGGGKNTIVGSTSANLAPWDEEYYVHGSHVSGTIAAVSGNTCTNCNAGNSNGVVGVVSTGATLYMANVGNKDGTKIFESSLIHGIEECIAWRDTNKPNAKAIVSMSLGGEKPSQSTERLVNNLYATGNVLLFAAAGNEGDTVNYLSYPAGYENVISVAALDSNKTRAYFSQYNTDVELAAPGVAVMSTVPLTGAPDGGSRLDKLDPRLTILAGPALGSPQSYPFFNSSLSSSATGYLVDCGKALTTCSNAVGKICLIERGDASFCSKANNCVAGGGIGALIYNHEVGDPTGCAPFAGQLAFDGCITPTIPVLGIGRNNALSIIKYGASSVQVTARGSLPPTQFASYDGTSMATPHASSVAGLVYAQYPQCSNAVIRQALRASALPLNTTAGYPNVYYGYGLVQAKSALNWLGKNAATYC